MSQDMLDRIALAEVAGPMRDLNEKLVGSEGHLWLAAFKRFLRRENPWPVSEAKSDPRLRSLIDCDARPYVPDGWSIRPEDQIPGAVQGQLVFDPARIQLYLDEAQKTGRIVATELAKRLAGKPLLPANVLDHLLANTNLIPDSWKVNEQGQTRYIYFWGTVYRGVDGFLCVRYLYWSDGRWLWACYSLGRGFSGQGAAGLLAS